MSLFTLTVFPPPVVVFGFIQVGAPKKLASEEYVVLDKGREAHWEVGMGGTVVPKNVLFCMLHGLISCDIPHSKNIPYPLTFKLLIILGY